MRKEWNLVELFSGIGSQSMALKNLGVRVKTLATCEWDVHAAIAYDLIHNGAELPQNISMMKKPELLDKLQKYTFSNSGKEPLDYESLKTYSEESLRHLLNSILRNRNKVDISAVHGTDMPQDIDIMTYSFPCQDLSNVGAFHGYNKGIDKDSGSRSSLLWQVGRILTEMKDNQISLPRFLLMENVPTLLSYRHRNNFKKWIAELESLGYVSQYYELNASSFGLPQNRPRLLMISVFTGAGIRIRKFTEQYFERKTSDDIVNDYRDSSFYKARHVSEMLRTDYSRQEFREEAIECTPNSTVSRRKIWEENPQIVLAGGKLNPRIEVVRTITTKQDRNPNSGNLYFESNIPGKATFRYLTPRECMLFMGFKDEDYERLADNNIEFHKGDALFARDKIIRMAGNSIPVKLLEGVFLQIFQIDELLSEFDKRYQEDLFGSEIPINDDGMIRSYMHSKGIRSRLGNVYYPENADIAYPKYRTAVYIYDCFWHGHECATLNLSENNRKYIDELRREIQDDDEHEQKTVTEKGWNVVIIWTCELDVPERNRTFEWLEEVVRNNLGSKSEKGRVISRGGY